MVDQLQLIGCQDPPLTATIHFQGNRKSCRDRVHIVIDLDSKTVPVVWQFRIGQVHFPTGTIKVFQIFQRDQYRCMGQIDCFGNNIFFSSQLDPLIISIFGNFE